MCKTVQYMRVFGCQKLRIPSMFFVDCLDSS